MKLGAGLAFLLISVAAGGCRPKLPEGLPAKQFDAIVALANQAARECDRLIALPDCYRDHEEPVADPAKAISVPSDILERAPDLQHLEAWCVSDEPPPGSLGLCKAPPFDRYKGSPNCNRTKVFPGWPELTSKKNEESVFVPREPECDEPWIVVGAFRLTPKGARLHVTGSFLSREWLASHRGAPPRPNAKPRPEAPDPGE